MGLLHDWYVIGPAYRYSILSTECEQLRAQLGTAESQLVELSTQVSALQEEKDSLVEKHRCIEADLQSQCDSFKSEVDLSMRRVAELAGQNADLEEEKETVFQKYEEAQQTLASYTTQTVVTVEERDSQLSAMEAKQQGLLDELDALRAHVAELEPRNKSLEDDKASFKETEECLKAENADVLAEVEILQSMISELTKERGAVEEDRQLLEVRVEALQQQVSSENVAQEMKGWLYIEAVFHFQSCWSQIFGACPCNVLGLRPHAGSRRKIPVTVSSTGKINWLESS